MRVKICGITNLADALRAAQAGAHYLGYIIEHPNSPRTLSRQVARAIIATVRDHYPKVQQVAVVVDKSATEMNAIIAETRADIIQLHGQEPIAAIQRLHGAEIWKAIVLHGRSDLKYLAKYQPVVDRILIDSGQGSGKTIAEEILTEVTFSPEIIMAGGLSPEKISNTVQQFRPALIDVNSGVEMKPGKKDPIKLDALFRAITPYVGPH